MLKALNKTLKQTKIKPKSDNIKLLIQYINKYCESKY